LQRPRHTGAFVVSTVPSSVPMRKPDAVSAAAAKPSLPASRDDASVRIVCLALLLALGALASRIASIW